ncbi:hypothetical protein LQ318_15275 [Aliifodinibius salicampi]|uniref:Bacterial repeat domain-containing protein n=1 Tax=Fodinibius salicampi TaxID=1920655 RepID=A0ABT3Q2D1_9BACT|nr:hypothetical protein [Fodinibius salicampi]
MSIITCSTNNDTQIYDVNISTSPVDAGSTTPADTSIEEGKQLSLSADANEKYLFTHWSGDVDSTSTNPLSITIDQSYSITANFKIKSYELAINTDGQGVVHEEVLEEKSKDYNHGTIVKLTADPSNHWQFLEWQGAETGAQNPLEITMDKKMEISAVFERKSYPLNISTSGEGDVSLDPNQVEYKYEKSVELTANPPNGWSFSRWKGDYSGQENPVSLSIDSSMSVTAIFENSKFAGGNGTQTYPNKVSTLNQLQAVNQYPEAHFKLVNNIDANATESWNNGKGFNPIGNSDKPFTGSFNGQNFKISNLTIDRINEDAVGFMGQVKNADIKNIILENVNINGDRVVGGIIAYIFQSTFSNSHISGNISGGTYTGGLVGQNSGSEIIQTSADVRVSSDGHSVGGLVGQSQGTILKSNAKGSVSGNEKVGGLLGWHRDGEVRNSYTTTDVSGSENIGGIIGRSENATELSTSYSVGSISGTTNVGGVIGINNGNISSTYWNTETTNQNNGIGSGSSGGVTGLSTSEMSGNEAKNNMPEFNWNEIWVTTENYPILFWE